MEINVLKMKNAIKGTDRRVGRGNACVDNSGIGGIVCALDSESGVVAAADELCVYYKMHPDTGFPFIGFRIPHLEAIRLAKEFTTVILDNRYTGWDFALTDSGWVLQEANDRGALVLRQLPVCKGCKAEIERIMKQLNL